MQIKEINDINQKISEVGKVLVIGAGGKTGYWYCRLLLKDGLEVFAYDQNQAVNYESDLISNPRFHKVSPDEFESKSVLSLVDSVSMSPGVPLSQSIIEEASRKGYFVFSELEYCFRQLSDRTWVCVTGTDGKSTTVSLIEHCLNKMGASSIACGNLGLSFSRILYEKEIYQKFTVLVAELSSYQLELSRNLQPRVSLYLNLAPDHLNRYRDLADYGRAKWNIVASMQDGGLVIVNKSLLPANSALWKDRHPLENPPLKSDIIPVDTSLLVSRNFSVKNGQIVDTRTGRTVIITDALQIHGDHNYSNILFTLETLAYFSYNDVEKLAESLRSFKSLPHRFEKIEIGDGNIYIDDSKATTTQASIIAMRNASAPLFVFLGGRSKGEDYTELAAVARDSDAFVFLYGENRQEIKESFDRVQYPVCMIADTLEQAFAGARKLQEEKGVSRVTYLLSPASTSWDQYSSFEERGDAFKKIVAGLVVK